MATPKEVAEWMLAELKQHDILYQKDVVWEIQEIFGNAFVYENDSGNLAISKNVLTEFRKLTDKTVVWSRGERLWRFREDFDEDGRKQN